MRIAMHFSSCEPQGIDLNKVPVSWSRGVGFCVTQVQKQRWQKEQRMVCS